MSLFDRITYQVMRVGAWALTARRVEIAVTGLNHIPAAGPVLLVARHYHHLFDGAALLLSVPRPIHIVVTLDWVKSSFVQRLMTLATTMARWPVVLRSDALSERADHGSKRQHMGSTARRYQRRALGDAVELLSQGRVLVVFPEGYPNIDPHDAVKTQPEEFLPFKSGFAAIVAVAEKRLRIKIPIVPVGFRYTKSAGLTVQFNIGEPVYLEGFTSRQLLVNYMEQRVAELSRSANGVSG